MQKTLRTVMSYNPSTSGNRKPFQFRLAIIQCNDKSKIDTSFKPIAAKTMFLLTGSGGLALEEDDDRRVMTRKDCFKYCNYL